jgi:aryl-alcohol dehydrogenase-like predicted oxidoreductase
MKNSKKIVLGTVQFGIDYGISNESGIVQNSEVSSILDLAKLRGINQLDTATSYGVAEKVLGTYVGIKEFDIITKISKLPEASRLNHGKYCIEQSLELLNIDKLYGVMTHDEQDLLESNNIIEEMNLYKNRGLIEKIGGSFYTVDALLDAVRRFDIDIVQIPISLFDQTFADKKILNELKSRNIEIHARSLFLQGLAFMSLDEVPSYFNKVKNKFVSYQKILNENNLSPLDLCFHYIKSLSQVDGYVIGAINSDQLLGSIESADRETSCKVDLTHLDLGDDAYRKPVNWKV